MVYTIKHDFQSGKADGTDVTLVKPSNWNAEHVLTMDEGTVIGRPPGSGTGPGESIPIAGLRMVGEITIWPGPTAPSGWMLCQGQLLNRSEYPALVAIIGGAYNIGGETAAQFRLPDLRGRVPAGVDAGANRLITQLAGTLGSFGGQENVQYYADIGGSCSVSVSVTGGISGTTGGPTSGQGNGNLGGGGPFEYTNHSHGHNVGGSFSGSGSGSGSISGGGYTRNATNTQPTIALNYAIKVL